ncbi:MAG: precorrin-2 dehydrogenase/sirohydrochlorin ferrochelatase family protein [Staphylococcus equorum]|uniref:precorrin-2 dehydrogenase/sirohydrochlorin ferrochelatase family protein n=1 Tax=Staphylococcus equorum TaxID=246432 RepID=UPI000D1C4FED|nr:NAD(P)-dependent oxidoreductase [Staphylococcus equorum]PTE26447.1 preprotein translocase subunit TatB [Staphylococcus equorum]PTE31885.1 preprotein translocase subunit TatB [Staphylococcus equorum]PTE42313.1 preprotein translocase subunit TatB [Staphylococcus equorum]PTE83639.1 preprotein translocase subunit TatB [Staphylococcus equorum]PTF12821.1 preprotein translocase subunit TatB [Staphylococcus equorum]
MYPIQLNLSDKRVVVIGAGKVAYRKVQQLIKEDIQSLVIISKKFLPEFFEIEYPKMKLFTKCYDSEDIKYADIIFAATDDEDINHLIKQDAKRYQLVNHIGDKAQSDFYNMCEIKYKDISIHFRSNGTNRSGVKQLSKAVQAFLNEEYKEEDNV